jgi:2-polyprenyl-3-methyl-5-hydroxy-6-metoxy-1,4-benzoquinol methylase
MMDVLEHAADQRALLARAHALLRPGGLLVFCTVDSGSLLYRLGPWVARAARWMHRARYSSPGHSFHLWTVLNAVLWHEAWMAGRSDCF